MIKKIKRIERLVLENICPLYVGNTVPFYCLEKILNLLVLMKNIEVS